MTGWNMPDGVNESDIPGNRPQDIALTEKLEELDRIMNTLSKDQLIDELDWVEPKIWDSDGIRELDDCITQAEEMAP